MPYMQRFCHIGTAIVNDNGSGMLFHIHSQPFISSHIIQICRHIIRGKLQIDKSRLHYIHRFKASAVLHLRRYILRNHKRRFLIFLCSRHSPVALIFAQVRPVGQRNFSQISVIPGLLERRLHLYRNQFQ